MISTRLATAIALCFTCLSLAVADDFSFQAASRDPGVHQWIAYQIVGPRNHPSPIVYVTTRHFKTKLPEFLLVLPKWRYALLSAYTNARIVGPACRAAPVDDIGYTFEIARRVEKRVQRCDLPKATACAYLAGVVGLSGVNWTRYELQPFTDFMLTMQCESANGGK